MLLSFLNATLTIQFSYVVMSKGKEKVSNSKQFRWLPPMHSTMLRLLAQEAAKGYKPSSTFKAGSFALVAKEIIVQFGIECHPSYVENHLRTLRTMWSTLRTMHSTMLRLLAQEAAKGNKPSSTFKAGSLAFVAKEITA